ncbi:MAG: metal-sensing transcriptional repressor [Proteobacteria bacterium]|nr:metal-sensing transcriptional repressor [Pseudomonadota bacterium]
MEHQTHPDITKRLRRAEGHIRSIVAMIEGGRSCLEIAQQMQAVERALRGAKETLIRDHLDHCLDKAVDDGTTSLAEFKEITKYL